MLWDPEPSTEARSNETGFYSAPCLCSGSHTAPLCSHTQDPAQRQGVAEPGFYSTAFPRIGSRSSPLTVRHGTQQRSREHHRPWDLAQRQRAGESQPSHCTVVGCFDRQTTDSPSPLSALVLNTLQCSGTAEMSISCLLIKIPHHAGLLNSL